MGKVAIRSLEEKDVVAVQELLCSLPGTYPDKHVHSIKLGGVAWLLRYILENNNPAEAGSIVLTFDEKIVGHLAYMRDIFCPQEGVYCAVAPALAEQYGAEAYGERLISHLEQKLKKIGARIVQFQTRIDELPYYRRLKFTQFGFINHYWGPGRRCYMVGKYFYPKR